MIVAGVDIGSLTAKAVVMQDRKILAYSVNPGGADVTGVAERTLKEALDKVGIEREEIAAIVSTGYGRARVPLSDKSITEITCDARGACYLFPETRMVIDIGGQDSKVISIDRDGRVVDFAMNDKCAAGTGRFLEVMAQALEIELNDLGRVSPKKKEPVVISSMCTVFAESEVVSLIAEGYPREDIAHGLHQAIAGRISAMAQSLGLAKTVILGGGVAKNEGVVRAIENNLKVKIKLPPEPQIVAALGAAICAGELAVR